MTGWEFCIARAAAEMANKILAGEQLSELNRRQQEFARQCLTYTLELAALVGMANADVVVLTEALAVLADQGL